MVSSRASITIFVSGEGVEYKIDLVHNYPGDEKANPTFQGLRWPGRFPKSCIDEDSSDLPNIKSVYNRYFRTSEGKRETAVCSSIPKI